MLIHDLTDKYGLVIRQARVTSVLDAAFDVVIVSLSLRPIASPGGLTLCS
jgi:protein SSD1